MEYTKADVKAFVVEQHLDEAIVAAFEQVDYDLEMFFASKANDIIDDESFYIALFIEFKKDLMDYFVDLTNGYWEMPDTAMEMAKHYRYLFLNCKTDEDIWDWLYDYCPTKTACQLYKCYTGESYIEGHSPVCLEDTVKAADMLAYLKNKE